MKTTIYSVSSVTNAMRGQKLLERNGIRAYVHRKTNPDGQNGCGYSLWVSAQNPAQLEAAERLLQASGIRILDREESGRGG